ncbi:iron complex transport system ATP-binding protein [Streptomyces sp. WMMB 714]|uniref:ABC transporter ATP-binding protein n=1 Tax=Streptomyces sp. WMMB 714 TaxID=1286822 RepID=UPI0005F88AC9|nr:ABC transporter ATP-binding protein [Streptomyces sp. WMMB 714]SCK09736.1 iron complex transport system ATP-binding protein [Streptomyces sp. WMMB 714]
MRIDVAQVGWTVGSKTVIEGIDVTVASGQTVGLIGPNGSGKSSLLRCVAGLLRPTYGAVRYDGQDIRAFSPRRIAQNVAFVGQTSHTAGELRVADVVALGRTPFRDRWHGLNARDRLIIDAALARMGLTGLAARTWRTLSGGEQQRTHVARALAQQPWGILLDEPLNHLDIRYQLELMEMLAATDQTVLVAVHDLAVAARFCDRLVLLDQGRATAVGMPHEVLTPENLRNVFGTETQVTRDDRGRLTISHLRVAPGHAASYASD